MDKDEDIPKSKFNVGDIVLVKQEWRSPVFHKHFVNCDKPVKITDVYYNEFGYTYDISDPDFKEPDGHCMLEVNELLLTNKE